MKLLVVIVGLMLLVGMVSATTEYATQTPPVANSTYVKSSSTYGVIGIGRPEFAFNTSTSLTGTSANNSWISANTSNANQVLSVDLGSPKVINRIKYENYHNLGYDPDMGAALFEFYGSNSSSAFNNTTYSNLTGWVQLTLPDPTYFEQHADGASPSDTEDLKYITFANSIAYRYYSFRIADNWIDPLIMGIRRIELQSEASWTYTTPGTYYWVCPTNVTTVSLAVGGGGGSGKGAYNSLGIYYRGYGGATGEWSNYAGLAVTPGTNYTIVVGAGGAQSAADAVSNSGAASSAFSHSSAGGAGGLSLPQLSNVVGGDGANGFLTGGNAAAGGDAGAYTGGLAGTGYSAGGGGGAARYTPTPQLGGIGGRGSDGYVGIYQSGYSTLNTPAFSGTPTSGAAGTLVSFTDESVIIDNVNMTYLWDFGDGVTSTTIGDVVHVFPYVGSYTVSLTINTDLGSVTESKEAYINLVSEPAGKINNLYPREVSFTLVDRYGRALENVAVSTSMTSSSISSTDWLTSMFGLADTSINSTTLNDTTDSDGQVVFPMIASGRYSITFTNASQGVSDTRSVHPDQEGYIYVTSTTASAPPTNMENSINITLWTSPPASTNPATVYLIGNYTDASATTSNITFYVNATNGTTVYSHSHASGNLNEQYGVTNTAGTSYIWGMRSTSTAFGNVSKAMGLTLKGTGANGLASDLLRVCNNWECT